ncbi:MAG: murein L,D-transpeptidase [Gemmatimonas sp.]|jgi:murein L,D-transpeptidase YcbB/YkuD|uniref:L,D-transpeptidase family protein n=1 Tax=Gemmatimonas sp. TaxID=1962908 RepID=UPI00391F6EBD
MTRLWTPWTRPAAALVLLIAAPMLPAQTVTVPPVEAVLRELGATVTGAHDTRLLAGVRRFYARRDHGPAWTDAEGWSLSGRTLQGAFTHAPAEGLDPTSYLVPPISGSSPLARARADVTLSLLALRFAEDLGWGIAVPGEVHRDNDFPRRPFPADSLLAAWVRAPDAGQALLAVTPTSLGYVRLREALAQLRGILATNGWSRVGTGPTLRRGASGPQVQELRRLLAQRGDLDSAMVDGPLFDDALAAAVARFQARHGLPTDSAFGPRTRAAFNVPVQTRIQQVQLGMERARWLPIVTGDRYIAVNLADYRAFVIERGRPLFETRVVVGATNHKTPMFTDTLTHIVFNPAWNVPPSIAAREIEPKVRKDPAYLARNHMVRIGRDIQQLPGPWNALGQVAFMFPNRHNVYMHDTPAKELFASTDRAFSHGCIRLQRPHELAELLLAPEGWDRTRIDAVIATGERTVVWLKTRVPVRISYATAFASDDGALHVRPDIYGRDAMLQQVLDAEHRRAFPQTRGRP